MSKQGSSKELILFGAVILLPSLALIVAIQTRLLEFPLDLEGSGLAHGEMDKSDGRIRTEALKIEGHHFRERRLPHAIIIGAKKSGTRALAKFLEINPAIRSAHTEVHFFDRFENYKRGLEWYRSQMPLTSNDQLTIEKSPAYFITKNVPERIKAMNASIKLILIMRNPVTRLVSDFSQLMANRLNSSHGDEDDEDYRLDTNDDFREKSLIKNKTVLLDRAGTELERHVLRSDGGVDDQHRMVRIGMYAVHLERWTSVFPRNQFHFVDGERLIKEPHVELQKLEIFLGFKRPSIMQKHFVFSQKKGFYCLVDANLTRDKRHTQLVEIIDKRRPHDGPVCLGKSKGRKHVSIGRELSDKLRDFYAPYNEYLFSLTGLNFK